MKALLRVYDGVITALAYLAGAVVVMILALIVIDVFMREVASVSFAFTLGVVEYGLLTSIYGFVEIKADGLAAPRFQDFLATEHGELVTCHQFASFAS